MQIHQILVRPVDNSVIILFVDVVGNRNSVVFDSTGNTTVDALVSFCQQRLPPDSANPAKAEIQQEIVNLENRLTQLKSAIGVA